MNLQRVINPFPVYAENNKWLFRLSGISEMAKRVYYTFQIHKPLLSTVYVYSFLSPFRFHCSLCSPLDVI